MHKKILNKNQEQLLSFLKNFKQDFCLVDGTAIALYLGHRQSIDFDLFSRNEFDNFELEKKISDALMIEKVLIDRLGEYTFLTNQVKITFLNYPFEIDYKEQFGDFVKLPELKTLVAMKMYALGRRSKWKDYVDLYFIFKSGISFREVLDKTEEIFKERFNEKLLRTQMAYFKDIDFSESVIYMPGFEVENKEIEEFLVELSLS